MSTPVRQKDHKGRPVHSVTDHGRRGMLVATFPARRLRYTDRPLQSPAGSAEMAVDGTAGGSTESVWDGTGVGDTGADWTLTDDYGGSSESAAAMHAGTNGLDTGSATYGDKVMFDRGSTFTLADYSTLTLWLNTQSRGGDSEIELEWRDATDSGTGSKLKVGDYITWAVGSWVLVSIPTADFAVTAPVQHLRLKFKESTQQHYIDEIALQAAGDAGPVAYRVAPDDGEELTVSRLLLTVVDEQAGWLHGDFAAIDGGLPAGLLLRWWDPPSGEVLYSANLLDNLDLLGRFKVTNEAAFFTSGRLLTLALAFEHPIPLTGHQVIEVLVRDNLSQLMRLQARAIGGQRRESESDDAQSESPLPEDVG